VDNKQIFSLFQAPGFIFGENPIQNPKSIDNRLPKWYKGVIELAIVNIRAKIHR
jgi:hypothetical protein